MCMTGAFHVEASGSGADRGLSIVEFFLTKNNTPSVLTFCKSIHILDLGTTCCVCRYLMMTHDVI